MVELLDVLGAGIVRALVAVRAGLVIAAAAFLELAIAAANASRDQDDPLKTFFIAITVAFGSGAVIVLLLFIIEQIQVLTRTNLRKGRPRRRA